MIVRMLESFCFTSWTNGKLLNLEQGKHYNLISWVNNEIIKLGLGYTQEKVE